MVEEGTKDVTTAQERTDPLPTDKLIMVNDLTKEVMTIPLESLPNNGGVAPVDLNDDNFFGI